MSDIQELIHKTSMDCIDKGQRMERERIIKLLETAIFEQKEETSKDFTDGAIWAVHKTASLIRGLN